MPGDGLEGFEALMGAFANLGGEKPEGLGDARCPKCNAADFVKVDDLFYEAVRHAENAGAASSEPGIGGLSEQQIIARFAPPRRRSARLRTILVAIPLAGAAYFVYARVNPTAGQFAVVAAIVITLMVFLTTVRKQSDDYYDQKAQWNKLYMCTKCGQLVKG
ncbi:MAG TPA: hypothetical protein VN706_13080 [Gemmatimonadaceae bacterium]|nr:hypothetical protein [Gemmatimonadaceae bacterium]